MRELMILPDNRVLDEFLQCGKYLETECSNCQLLGYLYFYRQHGDELSYMKIPYSSYSNTRTGLVVYLKPRTKSRPTVSVFIDRRKMLSLGIYYRSSFRNFTYEINRVMYQQEENLNDY